MITGKRAELFASALSHVVMCSEATLVPITWLGRYPSSTMRRPVRDRKYAVQTDPNAEWTK
jgi:hypothetical protein